jgi:general secretion pathway protein G
MVVVVIMGLLSGVVTISVRSYLVRGKQNVARLELAKVSQAIDTFYGEFDRYPTSEEGLEVLLNKSGPFPDGLLNRVPSDPWGHPYEYVCPGKKGAYEVVCYGADHRQGGTGAEADISSAELGQERTKASAQ